MDQLKILSNTGRVVAVVPSSDIHVQSAMASATYMSNDTVTINCSSSRNVAFGVGNYLVVGNDKYRMNQEPQKAINGASGVYEYTLVFESIKYDLLNVRFLLPDDTLDDFMTADLKTLVSEVVRNANRVYGADSWVVGSCPKTEVITQQFTEMNCLAAIQSMMSAYQKDFGKIYEFRVINSNGHNVITVTEEDGGAVADIHLSYGHAGGLYRIERRASNSENIVTRLYAYGSRDNIPTGYRHSRLCMSGKSRNESYVQSNEAAALFGIKEGFATFDSIRPRALFKVSAVYGPQGTDGNRGYRIKSADLLGEYGFNMGDLWKARNIDGGADYNEWLERYGYSDGQSARDFYDQGGSTPASGLKVAGKKKYVTNGEVTVTFNSGRCAGMSFKIVEGTLSVDGSEFNLVIQKFDQDTPNPYVCPSYSGSPLNPSTYEVMAGDEFVIANIDVPVGIIRKAEDELVLEAERELAYRCKANARYNVEFDQIAKDSMNLAGLTPGNFVYLSDASLGLGENDTIKVSKVERDLVSGDISVELSNIRTPKAIAGLVGRAQDDTVATIDIDGTRQTTLECQFVANYGGDANKIMVMGGRFDNYSLAGVRRLWNVGDDILTIPTEHEYDIYVLANKKTSNASIIIRRNTSSERQMVGGAIRQNLPSVMVGTLDTGCYYFRIGKISASRMLHGALNKSRTLTLEYGSADVSANDINIIIGGDRVSLDERIEYDITNVKALNANLTAVRDSVHSIVQTMQTGKINIGGRDMDIGYDWSLCNDTECKPNVKPQDLIPEFEKLK